MKTPYILAAAAIAVAAPAMAKAPSEIVDPYGANAIAQARTTQVERRLTQAYQTGDRSLEVLLNLAAIRVQRGDPAGARALYAEVLAQPNADMATLSGAAWSHDIAQKGITLASAD